MAATDLPNCRWLTRQEVADYLRISTRHVDRLRTAGKLFSKKIGIGCAGRVLIERWSVLQLIGVEE